MVSVVYRVALVATLAALTALLVVALPQGYAQEAPPPPWLKVSLYRKTRTKHRTSRNLSLKVVQ